MLNEQMAKTCMNTGSSNSCLYFTGDVICASASGIKLQRLLLK